MHAMSVDDSYRTVRVLGSGASGVTELVTIGGSGPFVRKKIPREMAQRCVWAALGGCSSPFLPRVWATYEMPEHFVVVCDYVAGETLESVVRAQGRLPEKRAVELAVDLCAALADLHASGVIHRDVSPSNVVVSSSGAHLIDFGIAQMAGEVDRHESAPFGTWGFAAPEQYGFAATDVRSDVYSAGRVLGFMLTGTMPGEEGYEELLHDGSVVDGRLRAIVERACEFEPSARYQDASALMAALEGKDDPAVDPGSSRASAPVQTRPAGAPVPEAACDPSGRSRARRTNRLRAIALSCLAAVAVVALAAVLLSRAGVLPASEDGQSAAEGGASSQSGEASSFYELGQRLSGEIGQKAADASDASDASSSSSGSGTLDADCVRIVDSGWYETSPGFLSCVVGISNVGDGTSVDFPEVTATGYAEDGSVLFSESIVFSGIDPGETQYMSVPVDVGSKAPSDVEFSLVEPEDYKLRPYDGKKVVCSFSGGSLVEGSYGSRSYCGKVSARCEDGSALEGERVFVTAVFRDAQGGIVGDGMTDVALPSDGSETSFEIVLYDDFDFDSVELYARAY